MSDRIASVTRNTLETKISVSLNLDGAGKGVFNTGVPFLEHMMDQIARHGMIDLDVTCDGDTHIDDHHSVEDIGIYHRPGDCQSGGRQERYSSLRPPLCSAR